MARNWLEENGRFEELAEEKEEEEKKVMIPFKTLEQELENAPTGPPAPSPHTWAGFMYVVGMKDLIPGKKIESCEEEEARTAKERRRQIREECRQLEVKFPKY
jgi:hypothetical protein